MALIQVDVVRRSNVGAANRPFAQGGRGGRHNRSQARPSGGGRKPSEGAPSASLGDFGPPLDLSETIRVRARKGSRAAAIRLGPKMWLITELDEVKASEVGFAPVVMAVPLLKRAIEAMVSAARKAKAKNQASEMSDDDVKKAELLLADLQARSETGCADCADCRSCRGR